MSVIVRELVLGKNYYISLVSNLFFRSIKKPYLDFYFMKTANFGILIIKIPDRMLSVKKWIRY